MLEFLDLEKNESVTLELPDGRLVTMHFLSKPRSNQVRLGFEADGIQVRRGPRQGNHEDGLFIEEQ